MDLFFNIIMGLLAALLMWIAFDERIHTGFVGACGAAVASITAVRSIDDSVLNSVQGTQSAWLWFAGGLLALIGNVVFSLWRAGAFDPAPEVEEQGSALSLVHPKRRRSDFVDLDEAPERASASS